MDVEGSRVIIKRKRTQTSRRPLDPSTPVLDETSRVSSDENNKDGNSVGKMFNLNSDGAGCDNKFKKLKFKVATIQPKSNSSNGESGSAPSKSKRPPKRRVLDVDFDEEDEDDEIQFLEKLKSSENKRQITLTTRQRALLTKDAASPSGACHIEFPNGLPPAPSRKQKDKLTEVEQQLKKAEVAQRRRMQNEKAARESEAEAIKKILGQDSGRKKRENKIKKRQEELAQMKATSVQMLASNTIRTVLGPSGTTVTFPLEMGLPEIFNPKPSSYPPPREKCAAPFCTNDYKYRDSRLRLPLCSLRCYKAINEKLHTGKAC